MRKGNIWKRVVDFVKENKGSGGEGKNVVKNPHFKELGKDEEI